MIPKKSLVKVFHLLLVLSLMLIPVVQASAKSDGDTKKFSKKAEMKLQMREQLKNDGTLDKLDKQIKDYYKENQDRLVDLSVLKNPDSPEAKEVLKKMEESMSGIDPNSDDGTVGTLSLGDDPPDGQNDISFAAFEDGDIIVVHDGFCYYGYYRHAGTYDEDREEFVSAQLKDQGNGTGVIWEPESWYQDNYDEAVGRAVDYYESDRQDVISDVMYYLRDQLGEPYSLTPGYDVRNKWYCSKLPWVGWKIETGIDISYGDYLIGMCIPDDIYYDEDCFSFAHGD